ncbi:MAG TPA: histidine phosphatase family protein [Candidatus Saccharimonadales bacterium]|nr:histidine phosphatase family protein [Candidatus Saccharimonadales bacterium]
MKLYLARHCRTNYNELELCNADPTIDVHLTSGGIKQAEALAEKLKPIPIDHIFASELKRTMQTAEIINRFHHLGIEVDTRLNDIYSEFEGRHFSEYMKALDAVSDRWTIHFNGGESIEDLKARTAHFIDELRSKPYDSILVITSEWNIRAMLTLLQGSSNEKAWSVDVEQGGYVELEI